MEGLRVSLELGHEYVLVMGLLACFEGTLRELPTLALVIVI